MSANVAGRSVASGIEVRNVTQSAYALAEFVKSRAVQPEH